MDKQYARVGTNTVAAGGTAETVVLGADICDTTSDVVRWVAIR